MAKLPSTDSVKSFPVGLNKGFVVTKIPNNGKTKADWNTSNKNKDIRKLIRSVSGLSPLEKRTLELFRSGVTQVEKRAFKLLRKRYGSRTRALRKREQLNNIIKNMAAKKKDE